VRGPPCAQSINAATHSVFARSNMQSSHSPPSSPLVRSTSGLRRVSAIGAPSLQSQPPGQHNGILASAPSACLADSLRGPSSSSSFRETSGRGIQTAGSKSSGGGIDFSKAVSGAVLESRFQAFTLPQRLVSSRLGLGVTAAVMFAVGLVDVYRALGTLGSPACAPLCLPHARLPFVLSEMIASACCLLALLLTLHSGLTRCALNSAALGYLLAGLSIALASASFDEIFAARLSTSLMLLFYALIGNVSGMRFLHVLPVCVLTFCAYGARILAGRGYFGDSNRALWHLGAVLTYRSEYWNAPQPMLPLGGAAFEGVDWIFWIGAAITGSLSASYSQESYERRRYVLVQRLTYETEKFDAFLYKMLPPTVVAQMKQGFHVADEFDDVFILASDIVGFTKLSAASNPSEVMTLLSQLFSKFDEISESMGVYKALTIGDAYIAVTGIFSRTGGDEDDDELMSTSEGRARRRQQNARAIVGFAMAMIKTIKTIEVPPGAPGPLNMRIGIHVGQITGGVIGTKRLRYDIWGASFLAATALESNGIPGEVCVSEQVVRHLGGAYDYEKHEEIQLKSSLKDGSTSVQAYRLVNKETVDTPADQRSAQQLPVEPPPDCMPAADPLSAATDHSKPVVTSSASGDASSTPMIPGSSSKLPPLANKGGDVGSCSRGEEGSSATRRQESK